MQAIGTTRKETSISSFLLPPLEIPLQFLQDSAPRLHTPISLFPQIYLSPAAKFLLTESSKPNYQFDSQGEIILKGQKYAPALPAPIHSHNNNRQSLHKPLHHLHSTTHRRPQHWSSSLRSS